MTDLNKIAEKIQHLLDKTVANGATESEAQTALLLAQKLMAKYNINQESLSGEEKISYSLEACKVRVNPRSKWMCMVIADSFAVKAILSGGKICYFGRTMNVTTAKSALEFAHKVMEHGMTKACRNHGLSGTEDKGASLIYNAYAQGFIHGLKEALDAQTVALTIVVPEDVKTEFAKRFPNLCKARSSGWKAGNYSEDYSAGKRDGSQVMAKRSLEA